MRTLLGVPRLARLSGPGTTKAPTEVGAARLKVPKRVAYQARDGTASALLNNSREVAGLLGITVIGAVLRSRQGAALSHGARPAAAFLDGYHAGLALTIVLVAAGVVISYAALRRLPALAPSPAPVPADGLAGGAGPGATAGPELAGRRS